MISKCLKYIIKKRGYPEWIESPTDENGESLILYISTYPVVAKYLAKRIGSEEKTIAELCCGVGTSLMYLGEHCRKVIGVDISHEVLSYCRSNLEGAKKDPSICFGSYELIQGDIEDPRILRELKMKETDIILYDIPYWYDHEKQLTSRNPDFSDFIDKVMSVVTDKIVVYAPNHFKETQIHPSLGDYEIQQVYLNEKFDRHIIYFGSLVEKKGLTSLKLVN
jgi:tRNA G10  N-methylase Trm11